MPIARVFMGENPGNPVRSEAAPDLMIIVNVNAVVVIDEVVAPRLAKDKPGNQNQSETDDESAKPRLDRRLLSHFFGALRLCLFFHR